MEKMIREFYVHDENGESLFVFLMDRGYSVKSRAGTEHQSRRWFQTEEGKLLIWHDDTNDYTLDGDSRRWKERDVSPK